MNKEDIANEVDIVLSKAILDVAEIKYSLKETESNPSRNMLVAKVEKDRYGMDDRMYAQQFDREITSLKDAINMARPKIREVFEAKACIEEFSEFLHNEELAGRVIF